MYYSGTISVAGHFDGQSDTKVHHIILWNKQRACTQSPYIISNIHISHLHFDQGHIGNGAFLFEEWKYLEFEKNLNWKLFHQVIFMNYLHWF